jgi:hypothetical protein
MLSQFGDRIAARYALFWWASSIGLLFVVVFPHQLEPVARFLGIQTVSNLFLSGLGIFLFAQTFELASELSKIDRRSRKSISVLAAKNAYQLQKVQHLPGSTLLVIPCFNEEESLEDLYCRLSKSSQREEWKKKNIRICFVDDGSSDGTLQKLQAIQESDQSVIICHHSANSGVASVLMTGFVLARDLGVSHVVQCDGDGQHPIEEIPRLVNIAISEQLDLLVGSRFVNSKFYILNTYKSTTLSRGLGIGWLRAVMWLSGFGSSISDPTSGFRVYSKRAVECLTKRMPDEYPEPETIALLTTERLSLAEYPVEMTPRVAGKSSLAGLKSIRYMIKVTAAILGLRLRLFYRR